MIVRVRGSRGTLSISSRDRVKYGSNTACVELDGAPFGLFFDAGTGLASFSPALNFHESRTYHIFLSHLHYDHIAGLPFFKPLHDAGARVLIYGLKPEGYPSLEEALRSYIRPPFLPFSLDFYKAGIEFRELEPGRCFSLREGFDVESFELSHPGRSLAYKLKLKTESGPKTLVYATDSSELKAANYLAFLDFIKASDLLFHDAFFSREEMEGLRDGVSKLSWGHSSWEYVVKLAKEAGVKKLGLFHHNDTRADAELDAIEARARLILPGAFCAYDYQLIEL